MQLSICYRVCFRKVVLAASCLVLACGGASTAPDVATLAGPYVLEQVDGASLPLAPPVPSSPDPCPPTITDGQLDLDLAGSDSPALYTVVVLSSRACEPTAIPSSATVTIGDGGRWSSGAGQVRFNSFGRSGFTTYQGTIQGISARPILAVPLREHTYTFRRVAMPRYPIGLIGVSVIDQQGSRVNGALLVVHGSNGLVMRAGTSDLAPPLVLGASEGPAVINIGPPTGYTFAPSQVNPVTINVKAGERTELTIVLAKTAP